MRTSIYFFLFIRMCRKYGFTYVLNTYQEMSMILRPNDTFDNITIKTDRGYVDLFKRAIFLMKDYNWKYSWEDK